MGFRGLGLKGQGFHHGVPLRVVGSSGDPFQKSRARYLRVLILKIRLSNLFMSVSDF